MNGLCILVSVFSMVLLVAECRPNVAGASPDSEKTKGEASSIIFIDRNRERIVFTNRFVQKS